MHHQVVGSLQGSVSSYCYCYVQCSNLSLWTVYLCNGQYQQGKTLLLHAILCPQLLLAGQAVLDVSLYHSAEENMELR